MGSQIKTSIILLHDYLILESGLRVKDSETRNTESKHASFFIKTTLGGEMWTDRSKQASFFT